jgi:hypothetical protein
MLLSYWQKKKLQQKHISKKLSVCKTIIKNSLAQRIQISSDLDRAKHLHFKLLRI